MRLILRLRLSLTIHQHCPSLTSPLPHLILKRLSTMHQRRHFMKPERIEDRSVLSKSFR